MFYDPREFKFLVPFLEDVNQIVAEFHAATRNVPELNQLMNDESPITSSHAEWWYRENDIGDDPRIGTFGAFPLLKETFPVKWYDAPAHFPTVFKHLKGVEGFYSCFLFRLAAGSGTKDHDHAQRNLIFHLCLTDTNGPSYLTCNGEKRNISKVGDAFVFDYTKMHGSSNSGTNDRVCLVVDFKNPF